MTVSKTTKQKSGRPATSEHPQRLGSDILNFSRLLLVPPLPWLDDGLLELCSQLSLYVSKFSKSSKALYIEDLNKISETLGELPAIAPKVLENPSNRGEIIGHLHDFIFELWHSGLVSENIAISVSEQTFPYGTSKGKLILLCHGFIVIAYMCSFFLESYSPIEISPRRA